MATKRAGEASVSISRRRILRGVRLMLTLGLLALLVLCLTVSWTTRDAMVYLPSLNKEGEEHGLIGSQNTIVDLHPWQTAQKLAALAATAEELEYAREAERLADHEVDQAFASALCQASMKHRVLTGEALKLSQKLAQLHQLVTQDEARVQKLTEALKLPASSAADHAASALREDDLEVAKAQLGLDSDELADAQQDLARAVGDERTRIQQELAAHESGMRKYDAQTGKESQVAVISAQQDGSLAIVLKRWMDQRTRYDLIRQAMRQAQTDASNLIAKHNQLESEANAASSVSATSSAQSEAKGASVSVPDKTAKLAILKDRAAQRQLLSIYDDRIQTQQQLAAVYGAWSAQVLLQHRIVLHLLLKLFALIAFILLCVIICDGLVQHLLDRPTLDRRRMHTLRTVLKFGIQVVAVLLIVLVIFGAPSHMPTVIGFTTAGLTVVLQDFILAFFGWFVLMGKNGIRVGDWVEINGISGEVVETGLFRTVLLETGNWGDKGHPTGRRVTLMNSFAIKGQYFNFSTTGQWMWDEITLTIPPAEDSYRTIELIHKAVLKETEGDARLAEQEWKRVARQNGLGQFTAVPAVDMRPGVYGIDIVVRYVTRASERFEVRNRLYQCVIDLLHKQVTAPRELEDPQPAASSSSGQDQRQTPLIA
jgi:small-conductance mechanosensitive channel